MVRQIPLDVVLSWPTPNYTNPVTRGWSLVIVNAILIGLVTTAVSLRYYARIRIKRWFGSDDVLITLAFVSAQEIGKILPITLHWKSLGDCTALMKAVLDSVVADACSIDHNRLHVHHSLCKPTLWLE